MIESKSVSPREVSPDEIAHVAGGSPFLGGTSGRGATRSEAAAAERPLLRPPSFKHQPRRTTMSELHNRTNEPVELSQDEIAAVSGGNGVVGPSGGKEGGGTIGSGT
jgi:hypothetical protein